MKNNVIQKIRKTKWWIAEGPTVFQLLQPPFIGFTKLSRCYPGLKYWGVIMMLKNNYGYQFMSEEDSVNWIKFLIEKDKEDKKYIQNKIKKWRQLEKKLTSVIKKIESSDLSKISNGKLYLLFNEFYKKLAETWAIPLILEGKGIYFEKSLLPRFSKEYNLKEKKRLEILSLLVRSEKLSFIRKEDIELLEIALEFIKKDIPENISLKTLEESYPEIYKMLFNQQRKFFWIRNNYKDTQVISITEFLKEIKNILKSKNKEQIKKEIEESRNIKKLRKKKKKIKKEIKLSGQLAREIKLFSLFGWWLDGRKRINLFSSHYLSLLIKEISKRIGIDYKDGYYLTNEEIKDFLLRNKKIERKKLKERERLLIIFSKRNEIFEILSGEEAKVYYDELLKAKGTVYQKELKEFKGYIACTGGKKKIKGKVNIVLNVREDKFKKGNILVTSMTRPEFVPLIKKAKAIITNEGGLTCHAAIVSRELNIPCIIGTKIATKVLKNRDRVEVNAEEGVVKIIK